MRHLDHRTGDSAASIYVIIALTLTTFLSCYPLLDCGFVNYDDPFYVTANNHVLSGLSPDSIRWAFGTFFNYNWHPATWLSHMLDVQLAGLNPAWHHLTSLLLHIANSGILFLILKRITGATAKSACVAALFALHPLHVESIAWVSERKDVLSTFFGFLAVAAYVLYAQSRRIRAYALCLLFFTIGLMAKPMLVTLPLVLLLLDYWPLWRIDNRAGLVKLVREKIPLFLPALISTVITWLAQQRGGAMPGDGFALINAGNAMISYAVYIKKMFLPIGLSVFYPFDIAAVSTGAVVTAIAVISGISVLVAVSAKQRPWLVTGWLWYIVTLLPVIGFIRVGQQALADRYTYIPLTGLFIIIVWGASEAAERLRVPRSVQIAVMAVILAGCSLLTYRQAGFWKDSITLFSHALTVTDSNWLAHKNLAAALAKRGDLEGALQHETETLRIRADAGEYVSQGWLYLQLGRYPQAMASCSNALAIAPDNDKARYLLGLAFVALKDYRAAVREYELLKRSNSSYAVQLQEKLKWVDSKED